ncbi:hypothetical protein [Bifidobacterium cuniculi]|uniref:hypothetical protein n=1 Tax=Bifidobacterium cuniculi TaxID=1688 RepID=UPI0012E000AF|nr:hypothetical protein [Bifidobacterium cuniculi]
MTRPNLHQHLKHHLIVSFQFTHTARVTALAEAAAKEQAAQIEREARMAELDEQ